MHSLAPYQYTFNDGRLNGFEINNLNRKQGKTKRT